MRQRLVRRIVLMLVVDVVVTHVAVDHLVILVRPNDGIVPTVPDLVRLWAGDERKAGRVYREQNVDVRILQQILFPAVPLIRRGRERLGQIVSRWMVAVLDTEQGRGWCPRVTHVRSRPEKRIVIPIPVCRIRRRAQSKPGKMETHPGATRLRVCAKRPSLAGALGTGLW